MPRGIRFKQRGKHLVVRARIALDPRVDQDLIDLLANAPEGGTAALIRNLLRSALPAGKQDGKGPVVDVETDHVAVRNPDVEADGEYQVVIVYRDEIPGLINQLAAAAAHFHGYRRIALPQPAAPAATTLPLPMAEAVKP